MKKIFSTILLVSLSIPSLAFALAPGVAGIKPLRTNLITGSSTKEKLLEIKDSVRGPLRGASSTHMLSASSTRLSPNFCSQIDKVAVAIDGRIITNGDKRAEIVAKKIEKRDDFRAQVDTIRNQNETKRKAQLEELLKRATSPAQKTALTNFTIAFTKALEEKNKSIDALLTAHRTEVDKVVEARKAGAEKALTTLKADIETAKTKAKTDCTSGVTSESVRINLKNDIQKAQGTFKKTITSLDKVKDVSSASRDTKKSELKKIEDNFKKSIEQARNDLKTALKAEKTSSITSTTTQ